MRHSPGCAGTNDRPTWPARFQENVVERERWIRPADGGGLLPHEAMPARDPLPWSSPSHLCSDPPRWVPLGGVAAEHRQPSTGHAGDFDTLRRRELHRREDALPNGSVVPAQPGPCLTTLGHATPYGEPRWHFAQAATGRSQTHANAGTRSRCQYWPQRPRRDTRPQ
jgi:hypothetical protein